jgi:hypothetical protein
VGALDGLLCNDPTPQVNLPGLNLFFHQTHGVADTPLVCLDACLDDSYPVRSGADKVPLEAHRLCELIASPAIGFAAFAKASVLHPMAPQERDVVNLAIIHENK